MLAIGQFTGIDVSSLLQGGSAPQTQSSGQVTENDERMTQFSAQVLATTEDVWGQIFPQQLDRTYTPPTLVVFSNVTQSPCGGASGRVG